MLEFFDNFHSDLNICSVKHEIIFYKLLLQTLISSMMHTPELLNMAAELLMFVYDENLFVSRSVREIAFGYHDPLLTVAKSIIPDWFYSDFVGVLAGVSNHVF